VPARRPRLQLELTEDGSLDIIRLQRLSLVCSRQIETISTVGSPIGIEPMDHDPSLRAILTVHEMYR
jgi:hypothetical protein